MSRTICEYGDCDQSVEVALLVDGEWDDAAQRMCSYHALVSLACGMSEDDVRQALKEADKGG